MDEITNLIPVSLYGTVSKRLIGILLSAEKTNNIPTALAKSVLYLWQRDQLENEVGIKKLIEATMFVEPDQTVGFFREIGIQEIAVALRERYL